MEEPNTTPVRETEAVLEPVLTENPLAAEQAESAREEMPVKEHYASDEYADLFGGVRFDTTADIPIPESLIDQVIGQEHAVDVIKKAATQRRHVMMIGSQLSFPSSSGSQNLYADAQIRLFPLSGRHTFPGCHHGRT